MKKKDDEITNDVMAEVREAIVKMVHARLAASKALMQVKSENYKGLFDGAVEALENVVDVLYGLEAELGDAHQSIIVNVATEVAV